MHNMRNAGLSNRRNRDSESWMPILLLVVSLAILYFFWRILLVFILAAFVAFVVSPLVNLFPKRIPRFLAILIVYLLIGLVFGTAISLLTPVVVHQYQQLADNLPTYVSQVRSGFSSVQARFGRLEDPWRTVGDRALAELQQLAVYVTREVVPAVITLVTSLLALVLVPLLAFFMLLGSSGYKRTLIAVLPSRHRKSLSDLLHCTSVSLWRFIRGEFILMLTVGTVTGVGLYLVGMPYSAVFGVLAGLLEAIPSFGPLASNIIVGTVAVLIHPVLAVKALAITIGVQLLENAFLVPLVMGRSVGLNPLTVAFAVFVGGRSAGILGAAMAIPLAVLVKIVILYFYARPEELPEGEAAVCRSRTWNGRRHQHTRGSPEPQA